MESHSKNSEFVKLTNYKSLLLLSFLLSVGICCSVLPVLPSIPSFEGPNQFPLAYSITRICLIIVIFFIDAFFFRTISKAKVLHKNQEVFWPMRCAHCAQAVGIHPQTKERVRDIGHSSACRFLNASRQRHRSADDVILPRRHSLDSSSGTEAMFVNIMSCEACDRSSTCLRLYKDRTNIMLTAPGEHSSFINLCRSLNDEDSKLPTEHCSHISNSWAINSHRFKTVSPHVVSGFTQDTIDKRHQHRPLYKKPHKSILNVFVLFTAITGLNIILQILGLVICLTQTSSSLQVFVQVVQILTDVGFLTVILFGMTFFCMYYDAVFLDGGKYVYPIGMLFAGCIWSTMIKLVNPLYVILGYTYNPIDYPCKLNGSFGYFLLVDETLFTPFYAECGIIGAGLAWQIWASVLPRSSLTCTNDINAGPHSYTFKCTPVTPFWSKILPRLRNLYRNRRYRVSIHDETEHLLAKESSSRCVIPILTSYTIISVLVGVIYFGLVNFIRNTDVKFACLTDPTKAYVLMCIELAFYLPVVGLYRYRNFLCDSFKEFAVKENVSFLHGLVEGHDRILLLSCVGIFTLNIFRFIGSIGLFFGINSISRDQMALACFTVVYALFRVYVLWQMTSFICVVQRQKMRGVREMKWTMICLAYTGVLNATQWLLDSVNIESWVELRVYYGDTVGAIIGFLLEPVASLYGIHAAMLAIEAYRSMSRTKIDSSGLESPLERK